MSGKDNASKVDDSLGKNHLVKCCDVDNQLLKLGLSLLHQTIL